MSSVLLRQTQKMMGSPKKVICLHEELRPMAPGHSTKPVRQANPRIRMTLKSNIIRAICPAKGSPRYNSDSNHVSSESCETTSCSKDLNPNYSSEAVS